MPGREMRRVPDVLAAFVRFTHDQRGVAAGLTAETLGAVEEFRDEFLAEIARGGRTRQPNAANRAWLVAGLDVGGPAQ